MTSPSSYRKAAETYDREAGRIFRNVSSDPRFQDTAGHILVQINMLQAIYCELRHGHDQQARQHAAMEDLTEALDKLSRRLGDR